MSQQIQQQPSASSIPASKTGRRVNWTIAEDKQLCASWIHVSNNRGDEKLQRERTFWGKIKLHFDLNIKNNFAKARTRTAFSSRWNKIFSSLSKYSDALNCSASDASWLDTVQLYCTMTKQRNFSFMYCWDILSADHKWTMYLTARSSRPATAKTDYLLANIVKETPSLSEPSISGDCTIGRRINKTALTEKRRLEDLNEELMKNLIEYLVKGLMEGYRDNFLEDLALQHGCQNLVIQSDIDHKILSVDVNTIADKVRRQGLRLLQLDALDRATNAQNKRLRITTANVGE